MFVDYATGTNEDRADYQQLLLDIRRCFVDVVLLWRYDRFARSTQALISESVKAARAKAQGMGRRTIPEAVQEEIRTLRKQAPPVFITVPWPVWGV